MLTSYLNIALTGFLRLGCLVALLLTAQFVQAVDSYFVYVSGYSSHIHCFNYNTQTGRLTPASVSEGSSKPSYMAFAPDGKTAYALDEVEEGSVMAFTINQENGALKQISNVPTGGKLPSHLSVHPSGKWVYVAHYNSGHVSVMPVGEGGQLSKPSEIIMAGTKAHMALSDKAGKFLFVPTLGLDQVQVYNIDQVSGRLNKNATPFVSLPEKAGPRHMAIAPDQKHAYVINELGWSLTSFSYDAVTASLSDPATIPTMADYQGKGSCAHVMVSPDGRFVYGSNRGHNSIVICRVDPVTGTLTSIAHESAQGEIKTPRNFNIDPAGKFMVVASQGANYVTVFSIDQKTGLLTKTANVMCGDKPSFVGFVPHL
jgi:6-phosphogluconolactonase